jgi:hypothetical protein
VNIEKDCTQRLCNGRKNFGRSIGKKSEWIVSCLALNVGLNFDRVAVRVRIVKPCYPFYFYFFVVAAENLIAV